MQVFTIKSFDIEGILFLDSHAQWTKWETFSNNAALRFTNNIERIKRGYAVHSRQEGLT